METACGYLDSEDMWFSSDQRKWITRIRKLAASHPAEVTIICQPETNNGCIYAKVPQRWLRIAPPRKMNLTEEQRRVAAERFKKYREGGKDHESN